MAAKFYFCWERTMSGQWGPAVYHGAEPPKEKVSEGDTPRRSEVWEVPADCIGVTDGQPMFGRLMVKFPAPGSVA